ncbi:MAG: PAS domain-containing protein [Microcoleus sp. SIO2G3]|nr:PAS domain-containing protein [Microcoleus sp. SIO2G3]
MSAFNTTLTHASSDFERVQSEEKPALLYGILEAMMDGILVITSQGQVLYANQSAQEVCQLLVSSRSILPKQIWRICEALVESQSLFPQQNLIIEDEIQTEQLHGLRIRVRWIECETNRPCLLVTIENRARSNRIAALAEARRYGLTSRETEVWLLRRTNLSYKAIAARLHIAIDTVKKHLKNIHAKQQGALWDEAQ